jgi:hypothetical protein
MRPGVRIPEDVEATIKAELAKIAHASLVARESKGAWSYATVWRVAARGRHRIDGRPPHHGPPAAAGAAGESRGSGGRASRGDATGARAAMRSQPLDRRPCGAARAAPCPSRRDDAHSGKRELEAERDILSLIARLQAPPAPAFSGAVQMRQTTKAEVCLE